MTLTWLHPFFLWLLPLASLPVIFHLFFRIRKRPRPFSTLMFFHRIDPRLSARRKILEWLVLLLRTLLILFLFLGLARPVWFRAGGAGSVAMVVVLDNSGSMSGKGSDGQPKLQLAINAAAALLSGLKANDAAGVVLTVDDPTVPLPPGLVSDKHALKNALARVKETEATGLPARALARALALLQATASPQYEIHIFTDLQEEEWGKAPVSTRTPRAGTVVLVHRMGTAADREANVALAGVRLPQRKTLAGRRVVFSVELYNTSNTEARGRLNWADDTGNKNTLELVVPERGEKSADVLLEAPTPGVHWINVWYEGDGFPADNKASLAYACLDKRPVLLVGQREEFGLLPVALSPSGDGKLSGLVPVFIAPGTWAESLAKHKPVLAVLTWDNLSRLEGERSLREFVEQGGNLLVTPSVTGIGRAVKTPDWLGVAPEAMQQTEQGSPVLAFKSGTAAFMDLRNPKGAVLLRGLKAFKFQALRLTGQYVVLLGLEDGRALLVERTLGRGAVYLSGLAFDPQWGTLPLKGGFLALAQNMALAGGETTETTVSLVAGERLLSVPDDHATLHIQAISGSVLEWSGEAVNRPAFPRSGVYNVQAGKQALLVSVRSSDKEGRRNFITGEKVPALAGLAYAITEASQTLGLFSGARQLHGSMDLFLPLVLLALACLAAEGWLANQPPRKAKEPAALGKAAAAT